LKVSSINSEKCIEALKSIRPDLVLVNGTRIISGKVLNCVNAKFIYIHAGITPRYRGVHGAYWAVVNKDKENCGVSTHFVDEGIDTGNIIYQSIIEVTEKDNFVTYPYLQLAYGINDLRKAIGDYFSGNITVIDSKLESSLRTHPTLFQYIKFYLLYKAK
jgi:methionyl-tRNA formyltransferase